MPAAVCWIAVDFRFADWCRDLVTSTESMGCKSLRNAKPPLDSAMLVPSQAVNTKSNIVCYPMPILNAWFIYWIQICRIVVVVLMNAAILCQPSETLYSKILNNASDCAVKCQSIAFIPLMLFQLSAVQSTTSPAKPPYLKTNSFSRIKQFWQLAANPQGLKGGI